MISNKPFLTARWSNLVLLTYRVDPSVMRPFIAPGCRPDTFDGEALVSLVAFDFSDIRVMGIRWPGFTAFPEINLRFYVRHGDDRGVCFVREFVPQRTVAFLARAIYNEPYRVAAIGSRVEIGTETKCVEHRLTTGGREQTIRVTAATQTMRPEPGSIECFLKDQQWGFGTSRRGRLIRYRVAHPVWLIHPVRSFDLQWDWSAVYGAEWEFLKDQAPLSVMLVEGSAVEVFPHGVSK